MIRNIKFPNIHNEIASISNRNIKSSIIISVIIKKVESSICAIAVSTLSPYIFPPPKTYLATSAYVSIAFIFFLFFSAIGMISLLAASKSKTLLKFS